METTLHNVTDIIIGETTQGSTYKHTKITIVADGDVLNLSLFSDDNNKPLVTKETLSKSHDNNVLSALYSRQKRKEAN